MNDGRQLQEQRASGALKLDQTVGYDCLDGLPLATLPVEVRAAAQPTLRAMTTAIAREGARGAACSRLLARTIVLQRIELRHREGLMHVYLQRLASGQGCDSQLRELERLVNSAHKRLLESIDCLARLGAAPVAVQVNAVTAEVKVTGRDGR